MPDRCPRHRHAARDAGAARLHQRLDARVGRRQERLRPRRQSAPAFVAMMVGGLCANPPRRRRARAPACGPAPSRGPDRHRGHLIRYTFPSTGSDGTEVKHGGYRNGRRHRRRNDGQRNRAGVRGRGPRGRHARRHRRRRRARHRGDRRQPRPARQEGQAHGRRESAGAVAACAARPTTQPLEPADLVIEAATESLELKLKILRQVDARWPKRTRSRHEHVVDLDHDARRGDVAPDRFHRHAFLQPGAADDAGGADPRPADLGEQRSPRRKAFAERLGKIADRRQEQPGLRRQSHPLPDDQRSDLRARRKASRRPRTSTTG